MGFILSLGTAIPPALSPSTRQLRPLVIRDTLYTRAHEAGKMLGNLKIFSYK